MGGKMHGSMGVSHYRSGETSHKPSGQQGSQIADSAPVLQEVIVHSPSDSLVRCLTILMRAPTPLNLLDPLRLCSPSSSGCSSGSFVSAQLDG
jgi:hypothetical protein